jgi:hypothetical protein
MAQLGTISTKATIHQTQQAILLNGFGLTLHSTQMTLGSHFSLGLGLNQIISITTLTGSVCLAVFNMLTNAIGKMVV